LELYAPTDSRYSPGSVVSRDIARYREISRTSGHRDREILSLSFRYLALERLARALEKREKGTENRDGWFLRVGALIISARHGAFSRSCDLTLQLGTRFYVALYIRPSSAHAQFRVELLNVLYLNFGNEITRGRIRR